MAKPPNPPIIYAKMKVKSIQQIGKRFNDWFNHKFEEFGLGKAIRTPGSGSGKIKGDSFNPSEFMFECKSQRSPSWITNIRQAQRQAEEGNSYRNKWVVIQRDPHSPQANPKAFAILDCEELLELLKKNQEPKFKVPDRDLKWKLQMLKTAINQVDKLLK